MDIKDCIIYEKTIPAHPAVYDDFPENLLPELAEYLKSHGIGKLYCHQTEMFEKVTSGKNVVITTSTASGKTLSFLLPVLQDILKNPLTRAIFIYPTKALAADQYRAIAPYLEYFGENRIVAGVYDGDTPVAERTRIRQSANIILTNPEMVNGAFLPNHSKYGFDFIFSNLKYIVIDELHTYRGAFGSHLANVFRRLSRVCRYYHSNPQFLCSSATIANPVELATEICGKQFILVDKDGSPAAERGYYLIQPPKIMGKDDNYYGQVRITTVAAELLPELMDEGKNFIAFTKSRKNVEIVLKETRDHLEAEEFLGTHKPEEISGYRGGYTPLERKQIENQMISGELMGLVSNAQVLAQSIAESAQAGIRAAACRPGADDGDTLLGVIGGSGSCAGSGGGSSRAGGSCGAAGRAAAGGQDTGGTCNGRSSQEVTTSDLFHACIPPNFPMGQIRICIPHPFPRIGNEPLSTE